MHWNGCFLHALKISMLSMLKELVCKLLVSMSHILWFILLDLRNVVEFKKSGAFFLKVISDLQAIARG
ncbi:hypothetical protein M5K25_000605 [Dendrobium thyrsiflorum]|uniref:Uncharacterized protein n=1 Tax=Dendrobium thyrsiflorum TaxID=117978 RepID=A0ABD0W5R3_DENTH